jgi:hypothetical protein
MLFDKSLGEDVSWKKSSTMAHAAHTQHKSLLRDETVIGSLAALPDVKGQDETIIGSLAVMPTVNGEADGVLAHTSRVVNEENGVLANLPMSNPDGVLAVYGHTGEYVEKMQLKDENDKLEKLQVLEHEAALLQNAQSKKLARLEKELHITSKQVLAKHAANKKPVTQTETQHPTAAVRAAAKKASPKAKQVLQAAKKQIAGAETAHHANSHHVKALASKQAAGSTHTHAVKATQAKKPQAHQQRIAAAAMNAKQNQHAVIAPHASQQHLASVPLPLAASNKNKLEEEPAPAEDAKPEEAEGAHSSNKGGIPNYNDVGWVKQEWDASSWVLFVIFGPIFTVVVTGLVWHCAGPVAASIMLVILICLDISSYYYSWFLV